MRAHVKNPPTGITSADKVSLTCYIRYYTGTASGFPGGRKYSYFSNATDRNSCIRRGAAILEGGNR